MEGFGNTDYFDAGKKKWAHLIMSSLWVTDQALPVPLCLSGAGVQLELFFAPASELFTSANVSNYTIEQPSFKWKGITPDPSYTISLRSAVAGVRSAYILYQRVHAFPSNGNGSKTQLINVGVGQVSSMASVETLFYSEVDDADRTKDKYSRFTNAGIVEWKIEGLGLSNPSQLTFNYQGGTDPETVLLGIGSSAGNLYRMHEETTLENNLESASIRLGINYKSSNEFAGTGLSTIGASSPFLTITTTHADVVPPTTCITTFVTSDALIECRGTEIAISEVFKYHGGVE
ncbi:hypothetical protein HDV00_000486 [Rhizophlyctis rosea]|nr:hypothetical protein HDV00_000486 [Rhizophlyctis rosea]